MDTMIREAELEEMEKKWKEENERIMREFPQQEMSAVPAETQQDAIAPPPAQEEIAPPPADGDQRRELP
jgi:sec-independent protein translocase protein TatB